MSKDKCKRGKTMKKKVVFPVIITLICIGGIMYNQSGTQTGKEVVCKSELASDAKYFKINEDSTCKIVKKNYQKIGILYDNLFALTNEKNDMFTNSRDMDIVDTYTSKLTYGKYTIEIKYYLYDSVIVDGDKQTEKEVSRLIADYYIKLDSKYLKGTTTYSNELNEHYQKAKDIPEKEIEKINLEIIKQLDEHTNLKDN